MSVDKELLQGIVANILAKRQTSPAVITTKTKEGQTVVIEADKVILNVKELILQVEMNVEPQVNVEIPAAPTTRTRKIIERSEDGKLAAIVEEIIVEKE